MKNHTTRTLVAAFAALAFLGTPSLAAHNNPWASEGDVLLSRNHDDNQLKSVGTPGQDEMRGEMKLDAGTNSGAKGFSPRTAGGSTKAGASAGGKGAKGKGGKAGGGKSRGGKSRGGQ